MDGIMAERVSYFDALSTVWDERAPALAPDLIARLLAACGIRPGDRVLDVGTGTGILLAHLLPFSPAEIVACDISPAMLAKTTAKYRGSALVRPLLADAGDLPLADGCMDVVICLGVYPHFLDRSAVLAELFRVAAPGARLVIAHFIGREAVNRIHAGAAAHAIHGDLLEPAAEAAQLAAAAGFSINEVVDTDDCYLVAGIKRHG